MKTKSSSFIKFNQGWRIKDIDSTEFQKLIPNIIVEKYISISQIDSIIDKLKTEKKLTRDIVNFRDCCLHSSIDNIDFDQVDYGYEEQDST